MVLNCGRVLFREFLFLTLHEKNMPFYVHGNRISIIELQLCDVLKMIVVLVPFSTVIVMMTSFYVTLIIGYVNLFF